EREEDVSERAVERSRDERGRVRLGRAAAVPVRDGHGALVGAEPGDGRLQLELVAGAGAGQITEAPGALQLPRDRAVDRVERPARGGCVVAAAGLVCKALET